jgi:2-C-methyl-D-erythritol 4-phosphate cytidylyltransferase
MNWLIIVAGGNGQRMGNKINKVFLEIKGRPVVYWTIKKAQECKIIDKIIVSVAKKDFKKIQSFGFDKIVDLVTPEDSRQASTAKILENLKANETDLIGVHNAANPMVTIEEIEKVYEAAEKSGAALLAMPVTDTIKIADENNFVISTPIRKNCWAAQTPQVARFDLMKKAFAKAKKDNFVGTDDSQLLGNIGIKAKIVECSVNNFKITYSEDLQRAKKII